jgi:class 3 adenylate cyclase
MDVSTWLRELGLAGYAQAFRANDIDADVLRRLTADDLIALGISSIGHRRKLLDAIAELPRPDSGALREPEAPRAAERRQLTVLFCDLVGSTELAARLDPEDMSRVIRAYQECCAAVVERWGGHVAKYMGDGVLAYFGWPVAHEDDAERAVRAGLALGQALTRVTTPAVEPLAARVGIATGLVVVGEMIGEGAAREEAVVGETPNLAARLQALAEPGGVVISQATRRLVGGLFELDDLGSQQLKAFVELLAAWRVAGEGRAEGRFEARHAGGLTPLVGREHELDLLFDRWQQASEGEGQVVLLSGEPGIGKSRLVRALRERLGDALYTTLSHLCSPFYQTSALHPVIDLLERAAGFTRDDPPARKLDKLEALLARGTNDVAAAAPLIAALLSLPTGDRYPPLDLAPERQKHEILNALLVQLTGLAAERPVLALYEDVQWADPSTLELLERVIERVQRLPVLVLVTFRPEFVPPWRGRAHLTALSLNRLNRRRGAAMVAELTGKALPAEVLEQILLKTDGVPLFVEELTKAVLELGLLRDAGDRYVLGGPLPPLAIPPTLQDSLVARLDRLAPVKEVAQVAACIGREFGYELLAAVLPLDSTALHDALHALAQAELVFGEGTPPHANYLFKHALVRDAAYESLLKSRRQALHARIAGALEERFPDIASAQPELVAHHCTAAGLTEKAVEYWSKAGQSAIERSAMAEAVVQLKKGLELLAGLPADSTGGRRELDLQVALGVALMAAEGWGSREAVGAYARARELSEQSG